MPGRSTPSDRPHERRGVLEASERSPQSVPEPGPSTRVAGGPPGRRRRRGVLAWLAVGIAAAAAGSILHHRHELQARFLTAPPAAIPTAEVRSGTIEQTLRLTGSTVAANRALLRAPYLRGRRSTGRAGAFGLVLEYLAAPGTRVREGDVIAEFDRMYMLNRLDDFRAARVEKELHLKAVRADLDEEWDAHQQLIREAKAEMDSAALDLKTIPVRSAIQAALFRLSFEEAKAAYEALLVERKYVKAAQQAEIRTAELELQEAEVEARRAEANADKMIMRAPAGGLVVLRNVFRGSEYDEIQAGDQLRPGQPFAQIVDPRSMVIEASANQVEVEQLRIGARAHVYLDAYPELKLPARVYSIAPLAKTSRWRANYVAEVPVFLKFERDDSRLIPNLTVSADVILRSEPSQGIVPREAVFRYEEHGRPFAYVRTSSGWEKRALELGISNNIEVAVHSGLSAGDVVAASPPSVERPG